MADKNQLVMKRNRIRNLVKEDIFTCTYCRNRLTYCETIGHNTESQKHILVCNNEWCPISFIHLYEEDFDG